MRVRIGIGIGIEMANENANLFLIYKRLPLRAPMLGFVPAKIDYYTYK